MLYISGAPPYDARRAAAQRPDIPVRRHYGRRLSVLAAAVAVPAMAAPGEWQAISPPSLPPVTGEPQTHAMPFEQAGSSFPGSAFYYLEDAPKAERSGLGFGVSDVLDALNPFDNDEADKNALVEAHNAGPAARSFSFGGSGSDHSRAMECLSKAVYYEAASESLEGQRAVAQVVLNRVAHPSYPRSVCGVVFQGSERVTGCQFSFTCDGSLRRKPSLSGMARARMVARDALAGKVFAPVGLATHYHTIWIHPYWADSLTTVGTIGAHRFYRWRGAAGRPQAFTARYRGGEPAARPHARSAVVESAAATDPLALAKAYEETHREGLNAPASAAPAAPAQPVVGRSLSSNNSSRAPINAGRSANVGVGLTTNANGGASVGGIGTATGPLPDYRAASNPRSGGAGNSSMAAPLSGGVRPEYANSGRWKEQPGSAPAGGADNTQ